MTTNPPERRKRNRAMAWRETHLGVTAAAKQLNVPEDALRSVIAQGGIKFDPQPDRNGRLMKVLRRGDVDELQQRMAAIRAKPRKA